FPFLIPMLPPPLSLFPYTTLFRSTGDVQRLARTRRYLRLHRLSEASSPRCALPDRAGRRVSRRSWSLPFCWFCRSPRARGTADGDRKSTRLNSSHQIISYAVFCLK